MGFLNSRIDVKSCNLTKYILAYIENSLKLPVTLSKHFAMSSFGTRGAEFQGDLSGILWSCLLPFVSLNSARKTAPAHHSGITSVF